VIATDKRAPMASAPMKYLPDGQVDWGSMWDGYCALALDGGPPHRASLLRAPADADPADPSYQASVRELTRGISAVSGLVAEQAAPGRLALRCFSEAMAQWLAEAIRAENVDAVAEGALLLVPVGAGWRVEGEIKNVITAVAKTTHYWHEHLPPPVKQALALQARAGQLRRWAQGLFRSPRARST
jgi:sirohydrochlorin cobaltochelatase